MGDGLKATIDLTQVNAGFDALAGSVKTSLARRMGVEGGVFLRDKAKFASVLSEAPYRGPYNPISRGSHSPGTLQDSIYLAFDKDGSTETIITYTISWNAKKAWWGKLLEFQHIRTHKVYTGADGNWYTSKTPLPNPITVPARPFLGPTIDAYGRAALAVMIDRGQKEFPILLKELQK